MALEVGASGMLGCCEDVVVFVVDGVGGAAPSGTGGTAGSGAGRTSLRNLLEADLSSWTWPQVKPKRLINKGFMVWNFMTPLLPSART